MNQRIFDRNIFDWPKAEQHKPSSQLMEALNRPIDLCCIFQVISTAWAWSREREDGGGDKATWGASVRRWDSSWPRRHHHIQNQVTALVVLCVCVWRGLNWFPLWWQPQSGWHHCLTNAICTLPQLARQLQTHTCSARPIENDSQWCYVLTWGCFRSASKPSPYTSSSYRSSIYLMEKKKNRHSLSKSADVVLLKH